MTPRACILGCEGPRLTLEEHAFFRLVRPWGFILFKRNIESAAQTFALCEALREAADDEDALIFIDQEGGRVQRARPPIAATRPPADRFGALYATDPDAGIEAVRLNHRLIAHELRALGVDADCAPSLDLQLPKMSEVIGDRAYGGDPAMVTALGRAAMDGLREGGVAPVIKHMPGHGRAKVDSHHELPVVDTPLNVLEETDFAPFRALAQDAAMGMTGHIVFTEVDADAPVTVSRRAIETLIRGHIGFDGLLMTDDMSMKALGGEMMHRSRAALDAGCDVLLHCNGEMAEMAAVAEAAPHLDGRSAERAEAARESARSLQPFDAAAAESRLDGLGLGGQGMSLTA
ncbi:MAG: beta-N-acetylhexosaminidase [Caulobacteraceae bacterium]